MREVCAPVPPCPSLVDALRAQRVPLHVYAADGVSQTAACTESASVTVTVYIDDRPVGRGEIRCAARAPARAPAVRIDGGPVVAGLHELRVEAQSLRGRVEASALVSLPAFDITGDEHAFVVGAEVPGTVGADDVTIGPPQVYPPKSDL